MCTEGERPLATSAARRPSYVAAAEFLPYGESSCVLSISTSHVGSQRSAYLLHQRLSDSIVYVQGKCTFGKRLSDDDVQRLTQYVLERADADWK